jgi:hypothetical protein
VIEAGKQIGLEHREDVNDLPPGHKDCIGNNGRSGAQSGLGYPDLHRFCVTLKPKVGESPARSIREQPPHLRGSAPSRPFHRQSLC